MKLLLYCTKAKPNLWDNYEYAKYMYQQGYKEDRYCIGNKVSKNDSTYKYCEPYMDKDVNLNGKIVAECDFEVEEIKCVDDGYFVWYEGKTLDEYKLLKQSCLNETELFNYLQSKFGYAIHIKNLHIFDKPRELSEHWIKQAPQNMRYGWCQSFAIDERVIIISIRPQWLCKILNGEKTIEVRKKVLKEMLK